MAMTLHRDLFVGSVAEELNKNGYFGKEVEWYCFLYWDGQNRFSEIFEDERECVKAQIALVEKGCLVSEYSLFRERIYEESAQALDDLKQTARARLEAVHGEALQELIERSRTELAPKPCAIRKYLDGTGQDEIAGFAWLDGDCIKYYVNAYLPNVWKKWSAYKKAGKKISYLYMEPYCAEAGRTVYQIKEDFCAKLAACTEQFF